MDETADIWLLYALLFKGKGKISVRLSNFNFECNFVARREGNRNSTWGGYEPLTR
jgi:hypothetical protein